MEDANNLGVFNFAFDPELDESFVTDAPSQDGLFLPNEEGRTEFLAPDPERMPVIENAVKQDSPEYAQRPADERTRELFGQMKSQRAILRGMLDAARTPRSTADIEAAVEPLREKKFSIYSTANICVMMETAGALERVHEDGSPYCYDPKPDVVMVDGVEYYEPAVAPVVCWRATEAGLAVADADDSLERVRLLFEKESDLLPVYKRVMSMAAAEEGVSVAQLSAAVDGNPLIAEPRRFYVQHFTEMLENREAIEWSGSAWVITSAGRAALEELADVEDTYVAPETDNPVVATETDGVCW